MTKSEVIERLLPGARRLNVYYGLHVSMTLAQIIQESGWLKNAPGNNFLGIKWTESQPLDRRQLLWTTEFVDGKPKKVQCWFMTYPSLEACMERYAKILLLPRYKETLESKDWWDSTNYVRINGYCTSPYYTNSLRKLILSSKLYEYDWKHDYDEPIYPGYDFTWGETHSNVFFDGKKYYRVIEPYEEDWENVFSIASLIQTIRFHFGKPIKVERWFSIPDYNAYIGGASDSQHKIANAIDFVRPSNATMGQLIEEAKKSNARGIGIMTNGLHLDLKKNAKRIIWYY